MTKGIDLDSDTAAARWGKGALERTLSVQRPVVVAHLRSVRKLHPTATPADILRILENRYLAAVTAGGAATGGVAAVPAVGTGAALLLSGAETVGFLEASALFAQSVAELHGIAVVDPERASNLVMALILGGAGSDLVEQLAAQAAGTGPSRSAFWGELVTSRMPKTLINRLTTQSRSLFLRRFAPRQGAAIVLRAIPFGIGVVIGGAGNNMLGRRVVQATREAFGPPPVAFPSDPALDPEQAFPPPADEADPDDGPAAPVEDPAA
jgi:hypothetical protein